MKPPYLFALLALVINLAVCYAATKTSPQKADAALRPHIVFVMVDDWGWANVGFHAQGQPNSKEIQTPNIDAVAAEGLVLDRHYAFRFCSPSRSAFHTGRNPIHVNVLNDPIGDVNRSDPISGFSGIPRNMTGIAQKLADAGYNTVMAGKWHVGLATPDHTPQGRGFASSLAYLDGANDYWNSLVVGGTAAASTQGFCPLPLNLTDLWKDSGPAYGMNNSWACSQDNQAPGCVYEDELFTNFAINAINNNPSGTPLFLYFAPHSVHAPLEVPDAQLAKFSFINNTDRQRYSAMVNLMDSYVGEVIRALKAQGMWDTTLLVISSDNGGPIYLSSDPDTILTGAANNWPLRGGKISNWEGGIRVNALVGGGALPAARRNQTETGLIGMEDWYATFCALAGTDPTDDRAAAAGLPPIDSLNMWELLSGTNLTSPRSEVILGSALPFPGDRTGYTIVQGLINSDGFKILIGQVDQDTWTGPLYPNASSFPYQDNTHYCGDPNPPFNNGTCLFNVFDDPTEHDDIAAQNPDIVKQMGERLAAIQATVFSPHRGQPILLACEVSEKEYHGFVGPFLP
jgi:arylsulfatase B